jgi:hypothetical protein
MSREELIKHVIYKTVSCGWNSDHQVFEEECNVYLELSQRQYISGTFQDLISILNEQFLLQSKGLRDEKKIDLLFYPYVYCIDKAMEATYNLRKNWNKTVDFRSEDMEKASFGLHLPMEVIHQIGDNIKQFELILYDVYYNLKDEEKLITTKTRPYVYEAMFWGAVYFGVEYCLRLEV